MDSWQKNLHDRLKCFVGTTPSEHTEKECFAINKKEGYVFMKALEAQEKYENPPIIIKGRTNEKTKM